MNSLNDYYVDRVITITGNLDDAIKAEEMLSEKMRTCYEQDTNVYQYQVITFHMVSYLPNGKEYEKENM